MDDKNRAATSNGEYRVPSNIAEVREYVLASNDGQAPAADTLFLRVKHNLLRAEFPELRLSRAMTIDALKSKLYVHVGTRPAFMRVFLLRAGASEGDAVPLLDDNRPLGYYAPAARGDTLVVVDDDPHSASKGGWLEDTSLVEKYRMTDDVYASRPDTYLAYKSQMRQKDPNWTMNRALAAARGKAAVPSQSATSSIDMAQDPPSVNPGDRVEVHPGGKRGVVMYVGRDLAGLPPGWWLGVRYDEPVGKNDGQVKNVRYFTAPKNFGGFVRPSHAQVGDYPPLDDHLLDSGNELDDEDEI